MRPIPGRARRHLPLFPVPLKLTFQSVWRERVKRRGATVPIKKAGGEVVVESEESAVVFGMPRAVMQTVAVDAVVPLAEVAQTMLRMA